MSGPQDLRALASRLDREDRGSAVVEFVFLTVVVLVPLIYLVLTVARIQAGTYAVAQAAREAGRAYVTAESAESAPGRAYAAAEIAFADFGFAGDLEIGCDGSPCLRPEGRITTRAQVSVPLPLVPDFARAVVPLRIPVDSTSVSTVDRFRSAS
ncbi:pilus assembly protein [Nostocoides sp. F2B08]|uniref:pilus assembly protein n=1 Tax=Nostocoides sp. F2B08 TaxID=2653936 RepID=UPI001D042050|nr:pilus assembly protein [Tetrasphaera sp. F2B08]